MGILAPEITLDRPLPQSPDAERAVLGACLISETAYFRVAGILTEQDFFRDSHRHVFAAMKAIAAEGRPIDPLTLKDELQRVGWLEVCGGAAGVSSLVDGVPDIANVERYARIIKREARKRAQIVIGHTMIKAGMDPLEEPEDIAAGALRALAAEGGGDNQSRPMWDVVLDVMKRQGEAKAAGIERLIKTTFPRLDRDRALRRKTITIVAAPTSHGKTTLMRNFAVGALRADTTQRIAWYSLEESDEDAIDPLLSHMSGVSLRRIQDGDMKDEQREEYVRAKNILRSWKNRFHFADRLRSFEELHADCRRVKSTSGLDVVFLDYLQLLRGFDETNGEQRVAAICAGLLRLAQDLDVSLCAGSQVNKEHQKRADGRLSISDMKYGAVIGEFSSVALMFQRPRHANNADTSIKPCTLIFQEEKNRGRETGDIPMHVDMDTQTFAEGTCEENECRWLPKKEGSGRLW